MCSIEEAWAGQVFEGRTVQSQADLHRKYMPISDNLMDMNNEFSIGYKEPQQRSGTRGINTKLLREPRVPNIVRNSPKADFNFSANLPAVVSNYGGEEPRPGYMSIYDNAEANSMGNLPLPMTKESFNDINQAFTVSPVVNDFMQRGSMTNELLEEDNDLDKMVLKKKFNNLNSQNRENYLSQPTNQGTSETSEEMVKFNQSLKDILHRLDKLEIDMHHYRSRNMHDIVLYILVGMLIAFILYSILRK